MARVKWTGAALDDLDAIAIYLARESPQWAKKFVARAFEVEQNLRQWPLMGHQVEEYRDPSVREVLVGQAYRLVYQITNAVVVILRVESCRRKRQAL